MISEAQCHGVQFYSKLQHFCVFIYYSDSLAHICLAHGVCVKSEQVVVSLQT